MGLFLLALPRLILGAFWPPNGSQSPAPSGRSGGTEVGGGGGLDDGGGGLDDLLRDREFDLRLMSPKMKSISSQESLLLLQLLLLMLLLLQR